MKGLTIHGIVGGRRIHFQSHFTSQNMNVLSVLPGCPVYSERKIWKHKEPSLI